MNLDIKNLQQQNAEQLVQSLELVSARVFDSVVKTNQLASSYTPEMQMLFAEWIDCISAPIVSAAEENGAIIPDELAKNIGVSPATIISLALTLHREGRIKITELKTEPGTGSNTEICGCLKG